MTTWVTLFVRGGRRLRGIPRMLSKKFKVPPHFTKLKSVFGFCNLFRRLISKFSKNCIAAEQGKASAIKGLQEMMILPTVLAWAYAEGEMQHRFWRRLGRMWIIVGRSWENEKANWVLAPFANKRRMRFWYDATRICRHCIRGDVFSISYLGTTIQDLNRSWFT